MTMAKLLTNYGLSRTKQYGTEIKIIIFFHLLLSQSLFTAFKSGCFFCSSFSICKINNVHKKSLWLIFQGCNCNFHNLLETFREISTDRDIINLLMTEVYKYLHGFLTTNDVFCLYQNNHNLQKLIYFRKQDDSYFRIGVASLMPLRCN